MRGKEDGCVEVTTSANRKNNVPFFCVYADLLKSEQFQSLTRSAQILYIDMGIASGSNYDDFIFPRREYKKRYSRDTFQRSKDQLIKGGFIKEKKCYKQESHYSLSSDWMRKNPS